MLLNLLAQSEPWAVVSLLFQPHLFLKTQILFIDCHKYGPIQACFPPSVLCFAQVRRVHQSYSVHAIFHLLIALEILYLGISVLWQRLPAALTVQGSLPTVAYSPYLLALCPCASANGLLALVGVRSPKNVFIWSQRLECVDHLLRGCAFTLSNFLQTLSTLQPELYHVSLICRHCLQVIFTLS
jgi:hypothetical protein